MTCPICTVLETQITTIQTLVNICLANIQYNEQRLNMFSLLEIEIGRRPYEEHLTVVRQLHQLYLDLLHELNIIKSNHLVYHNHL